MKIILLSLGIIVLSLTANGQNSVTSKSNDLQNIDTTITVEASCGQCNFKLPGKGCNLAIRVLDKAYFVDGEKIDDFGDAHAEDGFCNAIRHAKVKGKVVDGRFKSTFFKLLPAEEKK